MSETRLEVGNAEFNLRCGFLIAVLSGVMSGCFAWGPDAGQPIVIWCAWLIWRNRSLGELIGRGEHQPAGATLTLFRNYLFAALGGTLWYFQLFFYTMGEGQMGRYGFSSWTLHMASIILFSTLWGFALGEWSPASTGTRRQVRLGIAILVGATIVIGVGNMLQGRG